MVDIPVVAVDTLVAEVPVGIPGTGWDRVGTRCWPPAAAGAAGTDPDPRESREEARPIRGPRQAAGPRELPHWD